MLESQQRACTVEAELALLLRISHKYGKSGGQVLFSMGALEHIASCRAISLKVNMLSVVIKFSIYDRNILSLLITKVSSREI